MSTRRILVAVLLVAAVLAGAMGAVGGVTAQEATETENNGPPVPDNIALYGIAVLIAVLSPIAFAVLLSLRYRSD